MITLHGQALKKKIAKIVCKTKKHVSSYAMKTDLLLEKSHF